MGASSQDNRVLVRKCPDYDRERLAAILREGMETLGFSPQGDVFVKPNVVFAHDPETFGRTAFTPPSFVGAAAMALAGIPGVRRLTVGENCAVGVPTRLCFRFAGYFEERSRLREKGVPVSLCCMDEELRERVFVGGRVHDTVRLNRKMTRADARVYLPKLKCHCVSRMTGAVKLNIGILSDDERSIRHDFLLNEKIADLLTVGTPDFIMMDAIDVGLGNEAFPTPRHLGLVLMGKNPMAVDLVGASLLGLAAGDVPYLAVCIERGYGPAELGGVELLGDVASIGELDRHAEKLKPYDEEFFRWQDIHAELSRLQSPMRLFQGPYKEGGGLCETGCVMGLKMFLGALERFAGPGPFAGALPVTFVIGKVEEPVDARGHEVFLLGSCARATIRNAKKIIHVDKCFTTASDMNLALGHRLGMPAITRDASYIGSLTGGMLAASAHKLVNGRYFQDFGYFLKNGLLKRV
ncbi:MAG: DUF362 domain-containing protein [Proteobacteria bacterium]|nr:DUF362 domain-containing protein [Pseudomonadota bacterium]